MQKRLNHQIIVRVKIIKCMYVLFEDSEVLSLYHYSYYYVLRSSVRIPAKYRFEDPHPIVHHPSY